MSPTDTYGIPIKPQNALSATLSRVTVSNNFTYGLKVDGSFAPSGNTITVADSNSVFANNGLVGVDNITFNGQANPSISVLTSMISGNYGGLQAHGSGMVSISVGRSLVSGNSTGASPYTPAVTTEGYSEPCDLWIVAA